MEYKVIYLPSQPDPKKVREGLATIIKCVKELEEREKEELESKKSTEE